MVYYLGIDESNHGRTPEIFVGTMSNSKKDITKSNFEKKPKGYDLNLENLSFYHVVIEKHHKKFFDHNQIPVIAIVELIRKAKPVKKTIVDAAQELEGGLLEKTLSYLKINYETELVYKADSTYKIVNTADMAAHKLFRYYSNGNNPKINKNSLLQKIVTPKIEEYEKIFNKIC